MNTFYIDLLYSTCKIYNIRFNSIEDKEKVIIEAINMLPEKDRDFIEMLKPLYITNDPNGFFSLRAAHQTREAFRMNVKHQKDYKREVNKKLIENMRLLISK